MVGTQATETRLKQMALTDYKVLAFATHGLVAGEFAGLSEPALVLTPPETGSAFDDGLLTASEITQLKLDADWVILSACNTAAADGTPGAEGLSGLAKAFFYTGRRHRRQRDRASERSALASDQSWSRSHRPPWRCASALPRHRG